MIKRIAQQVEWSRFSQPNATCQRPRERLDNIPSEQESDGVVYYGMPCLPLCIAKLWQLMHVTCSLRVWFPNVLYGPIWMRKSAKIAYSGEEYCKPVKVIALRRHQGCLLQRACLWWWCREWLGFSPIWPCMTLFWFQVLWLVFARVFCDTCVSAEKQCPHLM